jgi:hypothetical protein
MKTFRIWLPRVLSIAFVIFLMIFSLDVFGTGASAKDIAIGLLIHNLPALFLLAIAIISWKNELVGGVVFTLVAIAYIVMVSMSGPFDGNEWLSVLMIAGPALLTGILFIINWRKRTKDLS